MLIVAAIIFVSLGVIVQPTTSLFFMFGLGIVLGFVNVSVITLLQLTTPSQMRGRVFGLLGTLSQALTPIAIGLSGLIADWTGQNIPLIYVVCGGMSFFLALYLAMNQELRSFLAYEVKP